jgi:hypothetical protein
MLAYWAEYLYMIPYKPSRARRKRGWSGRRRARAAPAGEYDDRLCAFLDFVLAQYASQEDEELEQGKLGPLIAYGSTTEAAATLGGAAVIRDAFVGFQLHLYEA